MDQVWTFAVMGGALASGVALVFFLRQEAAIDLLRDQAFGMMHEHQRGLVQLAPVSHSSGQDVVGEDRAAA